jgi:hypothetical protein
MNRIAQQRPCFFDREYAEELQEQGH